MADANFDAQTETDERERVLRRPLPAPLLRPPPAAQPVEPAQSPAYGGQVGRLDSGRAAAQRAVAQRAVAAPALETTSTTLPDQASAPAEAANHDLAGALRRQQLRESPPIPGHFATPPRQRAPGQKPAAGDWVGLYGHEIQRQQRLGGERGIDGRAAAEIQRLTAGGLGEAYRTSRQPLPERAQTFGGQLAALGQWPLGGQVSSAVLARLGPGDGPLVQEAMQAEQARLQTQARLDEELLARHASGADAAGPTSSANRTNGAPQSAPFVQPLAGQTGGFAGTLAAAGALSMPGAAPPTTADPAGAPSGGVQVQANVRGTGQTPTPAPSAALNQPGTAKPAPTTPATTAGTSKPAPKMARPVPAKVPVRKPAAPGGKAAAGKTQATAARSKGAAVPMRAKPKASAKSAAQPGAQTPAGTGTGSTAPAPSLRAVPLAQVPRGLPLKPVMQLDQTALFDGGQWKAQEAKEAQQAKLNKAGAGQLRAASLFTALATSPATRPAGQTAGRPPLSKLGRTLPAAKIKQAEAAERKAADAAMAAFVKRNQAKVKALSAAKAAVAPKAQGAAKSAQAKVAGAAKTASAQIAAAATSATGKVQAAGTAARAKIQADFTSSSQAIRAATKSAQATLQADHQAAVAALTQGLTQLNTDTRAEYTAAQTTALGISAEQAGEASKTGEEWAQKYAAEPLAKQSGWEDFTNGEDYPAKKREAKVQAARSVGQGYHDQLRKSGDAFANKLPEGAARVETVNQKLHDDSAANLDKLLAQNMQALQAAEQQAIQGLSAARQQQLQALDQRLSQARQGIAQQRASLTGQVQQQASSKQAAIASAASRGVAALHKSADSAVAGLNKQISGIQAQMRGKGVPDAGALKAKLAQADGQLAGGVASARSALTGGAQQTAAGLTQQGASAAAECAATAAQGRQGLTQLGAQAATSANQLASSAGTTFKGLAKGHQAKTKALTSQAKQGIKGVQDSFKTGATQMVAAVKAQMKQATTALENDLKQGRADEVSKIQAEAEAAAAKVQPRWKGWVSFIIDIVIAIAITALVIATAGTAGILMAIVVGVVAGAAGGVLGQLAKDGLDGRLSDGKTYLMAGLGGAIGGALGAVGGAGSGVLAKTLGARLFAEGAKRTLTTVAIDFVGNNLAGLGSQVAVGVFNEKVFGVKFDLSEVFKPENIAKNAVMTGTGMGAGKYFEANPGVPNRIRSVLGKEPLPALHVQAPKLDAPEVQAKGPNMPEVPAPKTEAPTAQTPGAPKPGEVAAAPRGKEPPTTPPGREAPPINEAPRPKELPAPPVRKALPPGKEPLALPPAPERLARPAGREGAPPKAQTEPVPGQAPETPQVKAGGEVGPAPKPSGPGREGAPPEAPLATETGGQPETVSARNRRSDNPDLNPNSVADLPGQVTGEYDYTSGGPLAPDKAATFVGQRYKSVKLQEDLVLYRVGEEGKPLGQFFDTKAPISEIQARIDKAVLPEWPGGGKSPVQAVHEIRVPKGTEIYVGEVANQGDFYTGGTRQVVVIEPWKIPGLEVLSSKPVNRIEVKPAVPAETVGGIAAVTPKAAGSAPEVRAPEGPNGPGAKDAGVPVRERNDGQAEQPTFNEGVEAPDFKASDLTARHRGDPFAFGKGPRAERAQAMVEEAVRASGISDLTKYVDVVTYEAGPSYFTVGQFGNRIMNVGSNAFGRTKMGQVHEIAHELVHAQQFERAVLKHGGDVDAARLDFLSASDDSARYALDEVVAERLAMRRLERHYGDISPQQKGVSTHYENFWREKVNWTEVFDEAVPGGTTVNKPRGGDSARRAGLPSEGSGTPKIEGIDRPGLRDEPRELAEILKGSRPSDSPIRLNEPPHPEATAPAQSQGRNVGGPPGVHHEGSGVPEAQGADGPGLRNESGAVAGVPEGTQAADPTVRLNEPPPVSSRPGAHSESAVVSKVGVPEPQPGETTRSTDLNAQELTQGLPPALRERVPVEINPELPGNTVRVKYEHENGVIKSVKIEAGPNATPRDIQLHAATAQVMTKYMGLRGRVRAGIDQLRRMVGLDGTPKLGTRAWEANLELQKLDGMIGDRQNQLAASQDPAVRARLEAELASLEQQVQTHEAALARMDQNPGEGFVAAEGIQDGTHPNTLEFNLDKIRKDLFGEKGRPGWTSDTKEQLKLEYPNEHSGTGTNLVKGNDRRHILAFDYLVNQYVRGLNGRQIAEIAETLKAAGQPPKTVDIGGISASLKEVLRGQFNDPENLVPGPAAPNQEKGRQGYQAEQRRAKAELEGDILNFELESRNMAREFTDVPPGKLGGNALTENETTIISEIDRVSRLMDRYNTLEGKTAEIRAGLKKPSAAFRQALIDLRELEAGLKELSAFSKDGDPTANDAIRAAIEQGMKDAIRLSEVLNK